MYLIGEEMGVCFSESKVSGHDADWKLNPEWLMCLFCKYCHYYRARALSIRKNWYILQLSLGEWQFLPK
jgi:hypothetical protein